MQRLMFENEVATPVHGLVALPNAASFNNTFFSEPLTTYAVGWRDPSNLQALLDFLFPPVQVSRRFEYRQHGANDDFLVDTDDERAAGADFKRVTYTGSIQQAKTLNRGLTMFVDMDDVAEMPNWQQVYTSRLLRRCVRNDLYAAVTALIAGADNTAKTWDANSDPDADLLSLVDTAGTAIGFNPNRLAFFGNAWGKRLTALRAKTTAGGFSSVALTTPDQVAQYVGAERGENVTARVKLASAGSKSKLGGNYVIAFYAEDGAGPEDPSHSKKFWTPCQDGTMYRVYVRQHSEKLWAITVERYTRMVVTSTTGLAKYTIS